MATGASNPSPSAPGGNLPPNSDALPSLLLPLFFFVLSIISLLVAPRNQKRVLGLGMLNSSFSKFEFRLLKFRLNSNFVYIFVEKLKQFAFDVCTVGRDEGHSTHAWHATHREAVYQQCNQPGRQAMSRRRLMSALCPGHQDSSL